MRTRGKWYAGWGEHGCPIEHEEMFDYFTPAQRYMVAELTWFATDILGEFGNTFMDAAKLLNDRYSDGDSKRPWTWDSPEYRYFIEWEPYPMSAIESKLA